MPAKKEDAPADPVDINSLVEAHQARIAELEKELAGLKAQKAPQQDQAELKQEIADLRKQVADLTEQLKTREPAPGNQEDQPSEDSGWSLSSLFE